MVELKRWSEKTVRREVYKFPEKHGRSNARTWTRLTVDGKLESWIPHDDYGELPASFAPSEEVQSALEKKYQDSPYASE